MAVTYRTHGALTELDNHGVVRWRVADAAARLALVVDIAEVDRVAHQLDDNSFWAVVSGGAVPVWARLDAGAAAATATQVIAGAGLTGGGTLAADLTLNVAATDGSIVVVPNGISVGVLQSDASHGTRGGGSLHADVVSSGASGFMTGAQAAKLAAIQALAAALGVATPLALGVATAGTSIAGAHEDHVHPAVPAATTSVAGLMSATDKVKVNDIRDVLKDWYVWVAPQGNGAGLPNYAGGSGPVSVGTAGSNISVTAISKGLRTRSTHRRSTTAVLGNTSILHSGTALFTTAEAWSASTLFAPVTLSAAGRWFCGLFVTTPPTDTQLSTRTNLVAVGREDGLANMQLAYSNGTGPATLIDLGASFPASTAIVNAWFRLTLEYTNTAARGAAPSGVAWTYTVERMDAAGVSTTGVLNNSNCPTATTLGWSVGICNNTGSAVQTIDWGGLTGVVYSA